MIAFYPRLATAHLARDVPMCGQTIVDANYRGGWLTKRYQTERKLEFANLGVHCRFSWGRPAPSDFLAIVRRVIALLPTTGRTSFLRLETKQIAVRKLSFCDLSVKLEQKKTQF